MHTSLRAAFVAIAALSLPLSGCKVEGELKVESLVRYEGQDRNDSIDYVDGQSLLIQSRMGNVDVIAGAGSALEVTFQPFTMDTKDNEQIATDQIREMLNTELTTEGDLIKVQVWRDDGASGNLGADIVLTLPAGFNGDFQLDEDQGFVEIDLGGRARSTKVTHTGPGDVTVFGASGPLSIDTSTGDAEIDVALWGAGHVTTGNGDIVLSVPAGADGSIQATANGVEPVVFGPEPLPADWVAEEASPSAKSFTFGAGGDNVVLTTEDLGDISIIAK